MAVRDILIFPHQCLRQVAEPVTQVESNSVQTLVDDMFETMYRYDGVGLAAPQVHVSQRIIVMDCGDSGRQPLVAINPELVESEGSAAHEEGCLSFPDELLSITRPAQVLFRALDRDGKPYEREASGLLARCIQHEIDHLDGRLFIDHVSALKRERVSKRMDKLQRRMRKVTVS